ncbi:MAG TPA: hypothetical protein PL033_17660 [Candidatus Brocadiia bacterium]|nr:hypothetical protein [Candidatus Brocadiia bacterium]
MRIHARKSTDKRIITTVLVSAIAFASGFSCAIGGENHDAKEIVRLFRQAVKHEDEAAEKRYGDQLSALGKDAIPDIAAAMQEAGWMSRNRLAQIVGDMKDTQAFEPALELAMEYRDDRAAESILLRLSQKDPDFKLNADHLLFLTERIETTEYPLWMAPVEILSRAKRNDVRERIEPVVKRFRREIAECQDNNISMGSYLSVRVRTLNNFFLAFSRIGNDAVPTLRTELDQSRKSNNEEAIKWFLIALGVMGDKDVAEDVRQIIDKDADPSTRIVAVRAYAMSAGKDGIPYLKTLLQDAMTSPYTGCVRSPEPFYPVRDAARDAIVTLERKAKSDLQQEKKPAGETQVP